MKGFRMNQPGNEKIRQFHLSGGALALGSGESKNLGPTQVRLQIRAASLNYRDLLILQDPNSRPDLVPLSDAAGQIIEVGNSVTRWKVGDRVSPNFFPRWTRGAPTSSALSEALGGGATDGVLGDIFLAEEESIVAIPAHLSMAEAASLPCAALTAWHSLFERGGIKAGETLLVQGTGGVALFGLQMATAHGAKVVVTSSSDEKLERAMALGAWKSINYQTVPEWDKAALELTEGRGVDHILELGGPDTYDRSISAVAFGGHIHQIGVLTGFSHKPSILPLQFKNANVHGVSVGSVEQFERMNAFLFKHEIRPVIDRRSSFEAAPEAYDHLKSGRHFGKVIITL